MPPTVKVLAFAVTDISSPKVTAPVPRFKALVPVNAKSAFHDCALLLLNVMELPLVLSIVPPDIANVPVPIAAALFMFRVPAERVVPPE